MEVGNGGRRKVMISVQYGSKRSGEEEEEEEEVRRMLVGGITRVVRPKRGG